MCDQNNSLIQIMKTVALKTMALLCLVVMVAGCSRALTDAQLKQRRAEQAKDDVDMTRPGEHINLLKPLTLEDCINIALENNLELRVKEFEKQIKSKDTLAEKLRMLPGLRADASYTKRDRLRKSKVYNWQTDQDVDDFTVSELKDSGKANLTLTWNVLDTLLSYVRAGQYEMQGQILEFEKTRQAQQLALDIVEAYWQAAALEDALDYVHAVEKELKRVKTTITQMVSEGRMDKMNAAELELRLKELELTIRQLQANLSSSRLELARLMGFNQNVQFTLARPPIKPIIAKLPHTKELDIDRLEEHALLNRPELFKSDIEVDIQRDEAKRTVISMFPGLSFFAATHYDDNRLLYQNTWNSVGAYVGWELLDLPAKLATYQGNKDAVEMAKVQRLMMTVGVITQVHIALLDYAIKVDRFRLLEETYGLSSNLLKMAKEKNAAGQLPELAVTQRYLEEMAAKLRRDEAVVDLLVAHKRLCVSIGLAPLDCDQELRASGSMEGMAFSDTGALKRWKCTQCDYSVVAVEPPETCPVCGADRSKFIEVPMEETSVVDEGLTSGPAPLEEDLSSWGRSEVAPTDKGAQPLAARGSRSPSWASAAADRFLWKVQLGAFSRTGGPEKRISQIKDLDLRLMDNRDAVVTTKNINGRLINRVRVINLTENEARNLANDLRSHGREYWLIPPSSAHWE